MPLINGTLLRAEFDKAILKIEAIRKDGKVSPELDVAIDMLITLMRVLIAALLEKTTPKTSNNSSIPPSQTDPDETKRSRRKKSKDTPDDRVDGDGLRKVTEEETVTVETCERCGADLSDLEPCGHECRVIYDIIFTFTETRITAEIKGCPFCRSRTKGQFPATMPGPRQYGTGLQAFTINLLIAHMLSLRRAVLLIRALTGQTISEATCLAWIRRLHEALLPWEQAARTQLLTRPALHADETGMRVDRKIHWVHCLTDGALSLKVLHPKRGRKAMDDIGIIPRYTGVLVHDCWASYFVYDACRHALCGSHLLRELTFVVESNGYRWARLMKSLLREACHTINQSEEKCMDEAGYRGIRKRYRTILTQGKKEMPPIPRRTSGRRGRIAKSDAHNLHERLKIHEEAVLRFLSDPDVSFTNNAGERCIRMSKVKMKVSGCFRTFKYAQAYCRISSYLQSMAAVGYNPQTAITIALAGGAADMVGETEIPITDEDD